MKKRLILVFLLLLLCVGCADSEKTSDESLASDQLVSLQVSCLTLLDNMDGLDSNKTSLVPEDGMIYEHQSVPFTENDSVFDVLLREMKDNKIHMEFSEVPLYDSNYIEGINNLYEYDCGELSGWMYKVNGEFPNYGCSQYILKAGDEIEWLYTCDLGRDIGKVEENDDE